MHPQKINQILRIHLIRHLSIDLSEHLALVKMTHIDQIRLQVLQLTHNTRTYN